MGQFDSLTQTGEFLRIRGGLFRLKAKHAAASALGEEIDLRSREVIGAAAQRLETIVRESDSDDSTSSEVHGTVKIGYKARPLNGVWATAPYLHNGSVPTLAELLKPAANRSPTFHVGSRVFDPIHVGFVNDTTQPKFDTTLTGNKNSGHEYGTELSDEDRQALLEYLKSL